MINITSKPISTVDNPLWWRIWHGTNYMLGGIFFILGSMCYFPSISEIINGDVLGGWLFTIGSTNFLLADLTEWNHFRPGCVGSGSIPKLKDESWFKSAELGINFFCSAIGSTLYLIGSIYFIPSTNMLLAGEWCFIVGSIVIFLSQSWKCYRTITTDEKNLNDHSFKYSNIKSDFSGFLVDLFAGTGGFFYAIGTWLFKEIITTEDLINASFLFVVGGINFTISGFFMQYRYYLSSETETEKNLVESPAKDGYHQIN